LFLQEVRLLYAFASNVIEKAINDWWDITILEYDEYCIYAFEQLERLNIKINYKLSENGSDLEKKYN